MGSDIYGNNHSFETAYDLGIDAAIQSADGASITTSEEKDYYSFKLTDVARITLTTSGSGFSDTVLYLYDSEQNQIAYNDDGGSDGYSRISEILDPGTYYVLARAYGTQLINDYSLTVAVSSDLTPPVVSNVSADITEPTEHKVTVTADFSDDVEVAQKLYRTGINPWSEYPSDGVTVSKNTTIFFKAVDAGGNESEVVSYDVTNIITTDAPDIYGDNHSFITAYDLGTDAAIQSADGASIATAGEEDYYTFKLTEPASITLATGGPGDDDTVLYLCDSDQNLIATNDDNGTSGYSRILEVLDPGTYYVIVVAYGNNTINDYFLTVTVSDDLVPPVVSNVAADITEPTEQSVTVTAEFSDDVEVAQKLYKIGGGSLWLDYPSDGVVVSENTTVYFKAVDAGGNESEVVSYVVSNIYGAGQSGDAYGNNHSFETAYDLGTDALIQSAEEASIVVSGETDYFSFTLTQIADVTLTTTLSSELVLDSVLYLYDSEHNEIAYNDDDRSRATCYSCVSERLNPGVYYAVVCGYGGEIGGYSLIAKALIDDGISEFTGDLSFATKRIEDGRVARDVNIHDGGQLLVSSGGSAFDLDVNYGGFLIVENGGQAHEVIENGGCVSVENETDVTFVSHSITGLEVRDGYAATLHSGTTAISATVLSAGYLFVYKDGEAIDTTVETGGILHVYSGGIISGTVVSSGGMASITSSAIAHDVRENGGYVSVEDGADVTFAPNTLSGFELTGWKSATIHSGTTATDVTVDWGGKLEVHSGGIAHVVKENGGYVSVDKDADVTFASNKIDGLGLVPSNSATVHSGTTATDVTVTSGARLEVYSGGTAHNVTEDGGYVSIENGAEVIFTSNTLYGFIIGENSATVHSGTTATELMVNFAGRMEIFQGGIASVVTINEHGDLEVSSGGKAEDVIVNSGGSLLAYSGAKLTGWMMFEDGAEVIPFVGSILDFDLTRTDVDLPVLVNDLSVLMGTPSYTITVDGTQVPGTYMLAGGASLFNKTITVVNTVGEELGMLSVGDMLVVDDTGYILNLDGAVLSVEIVSDVVPGWIFYKGDFNGDLYDTLAVDFGSTVTIYQNGEPWGLGVTLDPGWWVVGSGDFSGDGLDDFLRVNEEGYVVGEISNGNGTFSPQVLNFLNEGWNILGIGDFNGNGTDDVLIANPTGASESVGLLGYWESGATWTLINGYSPEWECVATGDYNGDGKCDMLWRNSFVGDGGLTYNAYCTWIVDDPIDWRMVSVANPAEWNFLCSGDFDGDKMNDIAMINDVGVVGIWGVNDGYLSSWSILSAVTPEWQLAGVGDFNADGTDDIAWANTETGLVGCWQIENKELASWQTIANLA